MEIATDQRPGYCYTCMEPVMPIGADRHCPKCGNTGVTVPHGWR